MTKPHNPVDLPDNLPVPQDDGGCDHVPGTELPALPLPGTGGGLHDLRTESRGRWVVLFCYPRTGRPGEEPPGGEQAWNATPGARGCTPQCLSYGRLFAEFETLGARVYGVSTQTTGEQTEAVERLGLPYELLSDSGMTLAGALRLPVFTVAGKTLLRRQTLLVRDGVVRHVRYPVFPSNEDAPAVAAWLRAQAG
jgi:peroxiredoxin